MNLGRRWTETGKKAALGLLGYGGRSRGDGWSRGRQTAESRKTTTRVLAYDDRALSSRGRGQAPETRKEVDTGAHSMATHACG
jgi:hypothetical protein